MRFHGVDQTTENYSTHHVTFGRVMKPETVRKRLLHFSWASSCDREQSSQELRSYLLQYGNRGTLFAISGTD